MPRAKPGMVATATDTPRGGWASASSAETAVRPTPIASIRASRARAPVVRRCAVSRLQTSAIGLTSGEYAGRQRRCHPAAAIACRAPAHACAGAACRGSRSVPGAASESGAPQPTGRRGCRRGRRRPPRTVRPRSPAAPRGRSRSARDCGGSPPPAAGHAVPDRGCGSRRGRRGPPGAAPPALPARPPAGRRRSGSFFTRPVPPGDGPPHRGPADYEVLVGGEPRRQLANRDIGHGLDAIPKPQVLRRRQAVRETTTPRPWGDRGSLLRTARPIVDGSDADGEPLGTLCDGAAVCHDRHHPPSPAHGGPPKRGGAGRDRLTHVPRWHASGILL